MEDPVRTNRQEWACTKFCRLELNDDTVREFIQWLCNMTKEQMEQRDLHGIDLIESTWGWDAPRQRMAKLLWQFLHGTTSEQEFSKWFSCYDSLRIEGCSASLNPIQAQLRWVMEGFFTRQSEDKVLGQGDWGEYWWLPKEQAGFVRTKLQKCSAALIERSSDYDDALSFELCYTVRYLAQGIDIPCHDPGRVYVGVRKPDFGCVLVVQDENGRQYPLKHAQNTYREADGTGFTWGYGGHGPYTLAQCILVDALDGDIPTAEKLDRAFFTQFTASYPQDQDFYLSRTVVLRWVEKQGEKATWEARRQHVADQIAKHAGAIAEKETRLIRIKNMGGLQAQRFDIVPKTFEAALYLDLMRMLERSDFALRCSGCGLPIPYDDSERANKQRARSRKGQPIYHSECFKEHGRIRKKIHWQRISQSSEFKEQQRKRSREYRKSTLL